ncbi:MAG: sulfite exporter TauE/SafE family protein [Candidatus Omnitrophica bacterium]|nr:sulfite exporter TauE/SafE family protein [Candidatus Omnitrophota bacterium]
MKIYIDVFVAGVTLGWGPCLYFCAPILLPYIAGAQKDWLAGLKISLAFSLARILPYTILSIISATLGQYLIRRFYQGFEGLIIYFAVGGLITLLGIIILIGKSAQFHSCLPFKKIAAKGVKEMFLLGLIVGLAPCIPLLGVLAYIAVYAEHFWQGALLGVLFGLGTLVSPLILLGPLAGETARLLFKKPLVYKIFSRICGLFLLYLGIGMVIKALQL